MEFKAKQIAELIQGRVEGDENAIVNTFAKIEEGVPGAISFLSNPKYTHYIYETKSSVVLINEDVELEKPVSATLIRVKNAYECVAKLLQLYDSMKPKKDRHRSSGICFAQGYRRQRCVYRCLRRHWRRGCYWRRFSDLSPYCYRRWRHHR